MQVKAIQIGQVDWQTYIKFVQDFMDESPTRGIDSLNIKTKEPIAFLKTLDFCNQPQTIVGQEHLYEHLFFSFIITASIYDLMELGSRGTVSIAYVERHSTAMAVISGTLLQWKQTIINVSKKEALKGAREIINEIKSILETAGFKEIWKEIKFYPKGDGTDICTT